MEWRGSLASFEYPAEEPNELDLSDQGDQAAARSA